MMNLDLSGVPVDVTLNVYDPKDPWYKSTVFGVPLFLIGIAGIFYWMTKK